MVHGDTEVDCTVLRLETLPDPYQSVPYGDERMYEMWES